METTAELAGFFTAHGIWCVSEGETLIPMLAQRTRDGERSLERLVAARLEEGVAEGRRRLEANEDGVTHAVLVVDGFVTLDAGKTDALVIDARRFGGAPASLEMVVPYRSASSAEGFAVYRPKFVSVDGEVPPLDILAEAFFRGVGGHDKGSQVWDDHLDQSQ